MSTLQLKVGKNMDNYFIFFKVKVFFFQLVVDIFLLSNRLITSEQSFLFVSINYAKIQKAFSISTTFTLFTLQNTKRYNFFFPRLWYFVILCFVNPLCQNISL